MPDAPDLHTPLPDVAHDELRKATAAAIRGLEEQVSRIDSAFYLLLSTAGFAQGTLNTVLAGQAAIGQMQATVGALAARVAALEAAITPPPEPEPEPTDPEPEPTDPPEETP